MKVASRVFQASKFAQALAHKEATGGILIRYVHPTLGVCYEVRYLTPAEEIENGYQS